MAIDDVATGCNLQRSRDKAFYTAHIKQDHEFVACSGWSVTTR